ncbi:MAG: CPBP family intramembrane metalloprotease [Streptococcus sp.]|nr:MAG: CPBP family intramembrane metalloprotease [Streptococcus sp.]
MPRSIAMIEKILIYIITFIVSLTLSNLVVKNLRGVEWLRYVRILLVTLPYLVVFKFFPIPTLSIPNFVDLMFVIMASFFYTVLDYQNIIYSNNVVLFPYLEKVTVSKLVARLAETTLIPTVEELFFRGILPIGVLNLELFIFFGISTLLFVIGHFYSDGNTKKIDFFCKLFLLSFLSFSIYVYSQNILNSILFHCLCNIPWFITNCRIFIYQKRGEKNVD